MDYVTLHPDTATIDIRRGWTGKLCHPCYGVTNILHTGILGFLYQAILHALLA